MFLKNSAGQRYVSKKAVIYVIMSEVNTMKKLIEREYFSVRCDSEFAVRATHSLTHLHHTTQYFYTSSCMQISNLYFAK